MTANHQALLNQRFLDLIRDNHLRIQKLCKAYTWDRDDHEDLYQEILCQLWRALSGLKDDSYSQTWLYRIALNTSISFVRKDKIRRDRSVAFDEDLAGQIPAKDKSIDSHRELQISSLLRAMQQLNPMEKAVITLYLEEMAYEQIAEITGLTTSNVGVTLHRAKKKLSELVKEDPK